MVDTYGVRGAQYEMQFGDGVKNVQLSEQPRAYTPCPRTVRERIWIFQSRATHVQLTRLRRTDIESTIYFRTYEYCKPGLGRVFLRVRLGILKSTKPNIYQRRLKKSNVTWPRPQLRGSRVK